MILFAEVTFKIAIGQQADRHEVSINDRELKISAEAVEKA
jgi:hypothetical protein